MKYSECRNRLREVLSGEACLSPASVFDPLSARVAKSVGHEIGFLSGRVASNTTLAAPDVTVMTLTELADQVHRIVHASNLSLIVDADHGFGNALNVMRTVEELEHAGVSALSIEDTILPKRFAGDSSGLISIDEMVGKLRAAVRARRDDGLIIAGRTSLRLQDMEEVLARVKAYTEIGIDAIFVVGLERLEQLDVIHACSKLPIIIGPLSVPLKREDLAGRGARILLEGHHVPVAATVKALYTVYEHVYRGGASSQLRSTTASSEQMEHLVDADEYRKWQREYLT